MKKIYALILAVIMLVSLFGCANGNDPVGETDNSVTTEATLGDHEHAHGDETVDSTDATDETTEATENTTAPTETEAIPDSPDDIGNGGVEDDPSKNMPTEPAPTEHKHDYKSKVTKPTCESKGYTTYTCSCGDSYTDNETKATGHSYKTETVAPTTEAKGYDLHTCKNCGATYKDNYKDKLPAPTEHKHEWVFKEFIGMYACQERQAVYTCACGETKTEGTGDRGDCAWEPIEVVAPTTEAMGYTVYKCSYCGNTWTDYDKDKLPAPTEPAPTEPAKCTNHEASAEVLGSVTVKQTWYYAWCYCDYHTKYEGNTRAEAIAKCEAHIAGNGGQSKDHFVRSVSECNKLNVPTFFECIHCGETCIYTDYYDYMSYNDEYFDKP